MLKKTLEDGTVLIAYYDDGFHLYVHCACKGANEDEDEPLHLDPTDYIECPGCGKRYETMLIPTVQFTVNGSYELTF